MRVGARSSRNFVFYFASTEISLISKSIGMKFGSKHLTHEQHSFSQHRELLHRRWNGNSRCRQFPRGNSATSRRAAQPLLSNFALIRRFSNFDHFITDFLSHMTHNVMGQSRKTLSPSFPREVQLHWWIVTELIINPPGFLRIPNAQKLRAVKNRTRQIRRRLK